MYSFSFSGMTKTFFISLNIWDTIIYGKMHPNGNLNKKIYTGKYALISSSDGSCNKESEGCNCTQNFLHRRCKNNLMPFKQF